MQWQIHKKKELLTGSDLANELASVLKMFGSRNITFIGDIKKMYFQVQAAEKHKSFLRFL